MIDQERANHKSGEHALEHSLEPLEVRKDGARVWCCPHHMEDARAQDGGA